MSFVFDPADPALYLEGKALNLLPLGPVTLAGIGFSLQGQIPYTPVDAPSQDTSTMVSGNLVLQGSVDTTAITAIPSKVAGDIILNLDPNHTDKFLGGRNVTAAALALVFGPEYANVLAASDTPLVENLSQVFRNLTVGINGTLELNPFASYQQDASWWLGNQILSLPTGTSSFLDQVLNWTNGKLGDPQLAAQLAVGDASLIYDGPSESFYFRGGTTDPFAGTPYLDTLTPLYTFLTDVGMLPTLDLDVAVRPGGEFYLDLTGTSNIAGLPDSSQLVLAHDYPVTGPATEYLSLRATPAPLVFPFPNTRWAHNCTLVFTSPPTSPSWATRWIYREPWRATATSRCKRMPRSISARSPGRPSSRLATRRPRVFLSRPMSMPASAAATSAAVLTRA